MGPVWNVTGPKAVVSSTTKPKHSLSGSMKKISSESFPCKREVMYEVYLKDWPEVLRLYKTPSRLNPARTSNCPKSSVTFTLAQPILELAWEPPSTSTSPDGPRKVLMPLRPDAKSFPFNPVEPVVNLADKPDTLDISNKHRLGHSEVGLVQTMIDGVNTLWKEDLELCKKARNLICHNYVCEKL